MKILKEIKYINKFNQVLVLALIEYENKNRNIAINGVCYQTSNCQRIDNETKKSTIQLIRLFLNGKPFLKIRCGLMTVFGEETTPFPNAKINNRWDKKIEVWLKENYLKFGGCPQFIHNDIMNVYLFGRSNGFSF